MVTLGRDERYDLLGAVDYLKRRFAGRVQIGILGYSMGATATLLAGAADQADVRAIISDSAVAALYPYIADHADRWTHLPAVPFNRVVDWMAPLVTGVDPRQVDAVAAVRRMPATPILFIAGTADQLVPDTDTEALFAADASAHKELWLVQGGGHTDSYTLQPRAYEQRVLAFFSRNLHG
jgi:fermentation-respiration switch protein FrsA (DUF1100 family)